MDSPQDIKTHKDEPVDQTTDIMAANDSPKSEMATDEQPIADIAAMDTTEIAAENLPEPMGVDELPENDVADDQISDVADPAADQAQKTLEALEQLPEVMEKLDQDNTQYELHVRLIEILSLLDFPDQLESARENMHEMFPLPEAMWLDWINDAKKELDTEEGEAKLRHLYDEAEKDYLSIPIWKSYVEYILAKFNAVWGDDETGLIVETEAEVVIEETREDLMKAVRATSYHIMQSHEIWNQYGEFEIRVLKRFSSPERLEKVKKAFMERLNTLHIACEQTFSDYSGLISTFDNEHYEENMVEANKVYSKTKEAATERDYFEQQLIQHGYSLDMFYQYIENEKIATKKPSLNNVRGLYERAVAIYCTDVGLWNDYILFFFERVRVQIFLEATTLRAVRNCPWSGILWAHLGRVLEAGQKPHEKISEIFDRALENKPLLASLEDLVALLRAKCDFERRRVDWEDPDEEIIMDLRVAFEEALVYLSEAFGKAGDPYYRIEKYYAFIEGKKLGNVKKAREIWEGIIKKHGRQSEAWIQFIDFERSTGNEHRCTSLFKQALAKNLDYPERIMDAWMTFEHEEGTVDSIEDALIRINKGSKLLTRNWQADLAEQEAVEEKKKEKEIVAKIKKSAHRRKLKETKKQTSDPAVPPKKDHDEPPAPTLKRKASETNVLEADVFKKPKPVQKTEQKVEKEAEPSVEPKPASGFGMVPHGMRNMRGRGRGKGTRLAISRTQPRPTEQTTATTTTTTEGTTAGPTAPQTAPKSNDDFRAMLLGKK
ncbi:hypothetical protein CLU79DRAFT_108127 [Phycomyces nitens]|nr:hypothetical protein CLU79DRAFT_108127 [Phycomyces nitens]